MISMTDLVPFKNLVIMYYFLVIYYILMAGNFKKKIAIPSTLYISSAIASALQKGKKKFSLKLYTWERQM